MGGDGTGELLAQLQDLAADDGRHIVAIAGPPGAGKSTLVDMLHAALEESHPGRSAILPMDGFHFDDVLLRERGDLPRKGAPHTFDVDGFRVTLERLVEDDGPVAVPVFDRALEISRGSARMIGSERRLLLAEGNYLLLDAPEWEPLRRHFDLTVFINVPIDVLQVRLNARWADLEEEARHAKLDGNDLPNARQVIKYSAPADIVLSPSEVFVRG